MQFLKWGLIGLGIVITASLYWVIHIDQSSFSDLTFQLIEQQTALGFPLWLAGLVPLVIGFILPKPATHESPTVLQSGPMPPSVSEQPLPPVEDGGKLAKDVVDEGLFMEDWKLAVQSEVKATVLPSGAQIVDQPYQNVQLGLRLTRTTPQNSRLSMVAFAEMLSKIPRPKRVRITFVDIMATGIPLKNVAQGAFTQYFGKTDFIMTEQIDGLEIRFNKPDERWNA